MRCNVISVVSISSFVFIASVVSSYYFGRDHGAKGAYTEAWNLGFDAGKYFEKREWNEYYGVQSVIINDRGYIKLAVKLPVWQTILQNESESSIEVLRIVKAGHLMIPRNIDLGKGSFKLGFIEEGQSDNEIKMFEVPYVNLKFEEFLRREFDSK